MTTEVARGEDAPTIAELLVLHQVDEQTHRGPAQHRDDVRLYGGLSAAQAIIAGFAELPASWKPSSVKLTFGAAGDGQLPVTYRREVRARTRTRYVAEVVAQQVRGPLLWATVAGHRPGADTMSFQVPAPTVPLPAECPPGYDRLNGPVESGLAEVFAQRWEDIEIRRVPPDRRPEASRWWMRVKGLLEGDVLNAAALAYLTDFVILDALLVPHDLSFADPGLFSVSLDFSIWWHHLVSANQWLLVETQPLAWADARSAALARVYDQEGNNVATIVQEGRMSYEGSERSTKGAWR